MTNMTIHVNILFRKDKLGKGNTPDEIIVTTGNVPVNVKRIMANILNKQVWIYIVNIVISDYKLTLIGRYNTYRFSNRFCFDRR